MIAQVKSVKIDFDNIKVDGNTLFFEIKEFLDVGENKINFLKKLDNPLMPENEKKKLEGIIENVRANEVRYREAVRKRNQVLTDMSDLKNIKPFGFARIDEPVLENIVMNIKKEDLEDVLLQYFEKFCRLNPTDARQKRDLEREKQELIKKKAEETLLQNEYVITRLRDEGHENPELSFKVDPSSTSSEATQKQNFLIQHFKECQDYKRRLSDKKAELLGGRDEIIAALDRSIKAAMERLSEIDDTLSNLREKEYSFKQFKESLKELIEKYPLSVSKDTVTALRGFGTQRELENAGTSSSSTTDSKIVKPAIKKPSDSKPKRPLTRSVATTKEEKKAVEEENPFQLPAKKGKTGNLMDKYEKDLGSLRTENANLRQQLKEADSNRRAALVQQEDNFRQRMDETLKRFTDDNYNLNNLNERLNKIISQRDRELKDVREQLEQLRKQLGAGNTGALKNNENSNNNDNAALENLEKLNSALKDRISALERELAAERAKNANSEQNAKEVVTERIVRRGGTTTVIEDTERIDALTKDIEARNAQLSQQQSALDSKDAQIRQLQQRNQQLQNQLNAQEDNKQSPASNEPSVNEENLKLQRQQLEEMVAELENKQNELKDREAEVSKREQTVNQMQQTTNNVLQMLNRQNNEASKNVNADQSEATKNGNVEMMPQVQLGA